MVASADTIVPAYLLQEYNAGVNGNCVSSGIVLYSGPVEVTFGATYWIYESIVTDHTHSDFEDEHVIWEDHAFTRGQMYYGCDRGDFVYMVFGDQNYMYGREDDEDIYCDPDNGVCVYHGVIFGQWYQGWRDNPVTDQADYYGGYPGYLSADTGSGQHFDNGVHDINSDGHPDLLGIRTTDGYLARWYGDGAAHFTYAGDYGGGWGNYTQLTSVGDINGDGKPDLVAVRKSDGYLARWTGDGAGHFSYIGDFGPGWSNYTNLTGPGDINGDGKPDLVATRISDGYLARWYGDGAGHFTYAGDYGPGWGAYTQLTGVGDINGDGRPDLVAIRISDGHLARWTGNGNGAFIYIGDYGGGWGAYSNLT